MSEGFYVTTLLTSNEKVFFLPKITSPTLWNQLGVPKCSLILTLTPGIAQTPQGQPYKLPPILDSRSKASTSDQLAIN